MPYVCDLCDGAEQAVWLMTPLNGGDTMAVGETCSEVALFGMLAARLDLDPEGLYDAVQQWAERQRAEAAATAGSGAQDAQGAAQGKPRAKPRTTSRRAAAAAGDDEHATPDDVTTPDGREARRS